MDIYTINPSTLQIENIIDSFESCIWTPRFYECGDFEIYISATEKNIDILKEGYFLCRDKDIDGEKFKNVMIIEKINIETDVEIGNHLTVSGRCLKSILDRRVIIEPYELNNTPIYMMYYIVSKEFINSDSSRKISNFQTYNSRIGSLDKYSEILKQFTRASVYDTILELGKTYKLGFEVFIENGSFWFNVIEGTDRSYNQDENPYVVFSKQFDNILSSNYSFDNAKFKNTALVAGEGEGISRKTLVVESISETGLNRREVFIDARDLSTNEGEISDDEYLEILCERGLEKLTEHVAEKKFEADVQSSKNYVLNVDYFLGDTVEVINEYGISAAPQIIEIIDSVDINEEKIIPTFSELEV